MINTTNHEINNQENQNLNTFNSYASLDNMPTTRNSLKYKQQQLNPRLTLKKRRRSRYDLKGRSFNCNTCDQAYLSDVALINHKKIKHGFDPSPKPKGRPPRKVCLFIIFRILK